VADNVPVTAGTGTNIATDERTISATTVHVQRVTPEGGTSFTTGHVTVTNSATTVIAARETRKRSTVINYQTVPIYVGPATVTTTSGLRLDPGMAMDFFTTALIQGITTAAYTAAGEDDKVHYAEFHD
jgi:hypothetical protein